MPIIDASIIVKLCIEETGSAAAKAIFESGGKFATPDHAYAEVAEVLTRKVRLGQAVFEQMVLATRNIAADIEFLKLSELISPAMAISMETGASVYDCLYVAAADRLQSQLVTADRRLVDRLSGTRYAQLLIPLDSAKGPR
jgi:predicted nucleic acid-binding protein